MIDLSVFGWQVNLGVLIAAAAVIGWTGVRLADFGDRLADRTGLGEAITGTVFLGLATALPGLAASVFAALEGRPALAIGNAIGGIAIQTTFLALADLAHRKANLEHAAASVTNMVQTGVLVLLLAIVIMGLSGPATTLGHVSPVTVVLLLAAGVGFRLSFKTAERPMWKPLQTAATVEDVPDEAHERARLAPLLIGFGLSALVAAAAGVVVADVSGNLADQTRISETLAGGIFSAVSTSLPEFATTVAAVRRGALTLAVGDIVGGNFFDVLFVFAADLVYLRGSLFHAPGVGGQIQFLTALALGLNVLLLLGLLYRQEEGPGNIGFESVLILVVYVVGMAVAGTLP